MSGTKEGTQIISLLAERGYNVTAVTATSYGTKMARGIPGIEVVEGSMTKESLIDLCSRRKIKIIIDATHPFPGDLSNLAKEYCLTQNFPYIRFLREETDLPDSDLIHLVYSWEEAASKSAHLGDTIFLTTGSNNLEVFLNNQLLTGRRIVVRVLPDYKIVKKCQDLGLIPKNIIAMQGPFSKEMNRQQYKMYNASVIVMKDSGKAGGTDTKISAALSLGIPVVVIKRNKQKEKHQVTNFEDLLEIINQVHKPGNK